MDTKKIRSILDWMKTTDLVEVSYKKGDVAFALSAKDASAPIPEGDRMASRFVPVASDAVGVFQWAAPGKPRISEEGCEVATNAILAVIISGSGTAKPVLAPCAGRVAKIFADAGEAVEYGRPLFLLEPKV